MSNKEIQVPVFVLLADDDKDDRFFFKKALNEITIATVLNTVPNGESLMEYLSDHPKSLPDVLFLDLNMPRKNGNECLVEIKSNPLFKDMPVIIYSTSLREEVADVLYQNGAHYFLQKCDFAELNKTLQFIFNTLIRSTKRPARNKFVACLKELNKELS